MPKIREIPTMIVNPRICPMLILTKADTVSGLVIQRVFTYSLAKKISITQKSSTVVEKNDKIARVMELLVNTISGMLLVQACGSRVTYILNQVVIDYVICAPTQSNYWLCCQIQIRIELSTFFHFILSGTPWDS